MYVTVHLAKTKCRVKQTKKRLSLHCPATAFHFVERTDIQLTFPLQENFYRSKRHIPTTVTLTVGFKT